MSYLVRQRPIAAWIASHISCCSRRLYGSPSAPKSTGAKKQKPTVRPQITSVYVRDETAADKNAVVRALQAPQAGHGTKSHHQQQKTEGNSPKSISSDGRPFDAAVVLTTPGLAGWLEDEAFMASLLVETGKQGGADGSMGSDVPPAEGISVLAAVVDGFALPPDMEAEAQSQLGIDGLTGAKRASLGKGIAVVRGFRKQLLPEFAVGEEKDESGRGKAGDGRLAVNGGEHEKAGIVFRLPMTDCWQKQDHKREGWMEVTTPVANTVFQNGRVSTVFTSRSAGPAWSDITEVERSYVTSQVVRVPTSKGYTVARAPLVVVTPLRQVKSALGNILKTLVEPDGGGEVPASKRLEEIVPRLLQSRRRMNLPEIVGPLNVWALLVPGEAAYMFRNLRELQRPHVSANNLLGYGCRLHRVLSGGGGWGAKQGLLSLDPQVALTTTEEEDVDRFERDFMASREGGRGAGGSVVGPGDHVLFCIDDKVLPSPPPPQVSPDAALLPDMTFRAVVKPSAEMSEEVSTTAISGDEGLRRVDAFFGVASTAMFVAPAAAASPSEESPARMPASVKIDVPDASMDVC